MTKYYLLILILLAILVSVYNLYSNYSLNNKILSLNSKLSELSLSTDKIKEQYSHLLKKKNNNQLDNDDNFVNTVHLSNNRDIDYISNKDIEKLNHKGNIIQNDIEVLRDEIKNIEDLISDSTESKNSKKNNDSEFDGLANIDLDNNSEFGSFLDKNVNENDIKNKENTDIEILSDLNSKENLSELNNEINNFHSEVNLSELNSEINNLHSEVNLTSNNLENNLNYEDNSINQNDNSKKIELTKDEIKISDNNSDDNIDKKSQKKQNRDNIIKLIDNIIEPKKQINVNIILNNYTKKQLEQYCVELNLSKSGSKQILVDRLLDNNYIFKKTEQQELSV